MLAATTCKNRTQPRHPVHLFNYAQKTPLICFSRLCVICVGIFSITSTVPTPQSAKAKTNLSFLFGWETPALNWFHSIDWGIAMSLIGLLWLVYSQSVSLKNQCQKKEEFAREFVNPPENVLTHNLAKKRPFIPVFLHSRQSKSWSSVLAIYLSFPITCYPSIF